MIEEGNGYNYCLDTRTGIIIAHLHLPFPYWQASTCLRWRNVSLVSTQWSGSKAKSFNNNMWLHSPLYYTMLYRGSDLQPKVQLISILSKSKKCTKVDGQWNWTNMTAPRVYLITDNLLNSGRRSCAQGQCRSLFATIPIMHTDKKAPPWKCLMCVIRYCIVYKDNSVPLEWHINYDFTLAIIIVNMSQRHANRVELELRYYTHCISSLAYSPVTVKTWTL